MKKEAEKKTAKTPTATAKRAARAKTTRTVKKAQVIHQIIEKIEAKLKKGVEKATLGDYIKLMQLEKELESDDPPDVNAGWVEPTDSENPNSTE